MKKIIFLSILILVCSVSFYSCKKNKDEEAVADFTYTTIAHGGVEVTFTGKGNATWDFGGQGVQQELTSKIIRYYYQSNGSYTIKLNSENKGSTKEKSVSILITAVPTKVKIISVKLNDFRATNDANAPWDSDLSGPDVKFAYLDPIMGYQDLTGLFPNLQNSQLPISNTLSTPKIIDIINDGVLEVVCYDDNYSNVQAIEGIQIIFENVTAKSKCVTCAQTFYPSKYSSFNNSYTKMEVGLEWIP